MLTISATVLTLWLFSAGILSKYIQYFIWALLVLVIYIRALTSKPPEIQEQDESFETLKR
jgi:hypothetical protein